MFHLTRGMPYHIAKPGFKRGNHTVATGVIDMVSDRWDRGAQQIEHHAATARPPAGNKRVQNITLPARWIIDQA